MTAIQTIKEGLEPVESFVEIIKGNPKIHCIVNDVAAALTANTLLAVGAQPSMTNNHCEVPAFTESSDALSINLGMLTDERIRAIREASICASENRIPWVLDATMIDRSGTRLEFCLELLGNRPAVIRGNKAEVSALCRNLDLTTIQFCQKYGAVLVATGAADRVNSGSRRCKLERLGHPWMSRVSGMGCALSALIAAMLTAYSDAFDASVDTLHLYGAVGKRAASNSQGPGSFAAAFIDELAV